jgi:hypothetical protein
MSGNLQRHRFVTYTEESRQDGIYHDKYFLALDLQFKMTEVISEASQFVVSWCLKICYSRRSALRSLNALLSLGRACQWPP